MLDDSPGFVVRSALTQAAWDKGFRLQREPFGRWLTFDSTTARGRVWLAGESDHGPWWLASDHPGVLAEFGPGSDDGAPGLRAWTYPDKRRLYEALDRAYQLGASLPNAPLVEYLAETDALPRTTEAERLVLQRVGQNVFRRALMLYWGGRCAVTGISDPALLRASHVVPWAACATDDERLDVNNGLLLSALWDAAFDAGLVSFSPIGDAVLSAKLTSTAQATLGPGRRLRRSLSERQIAYMRRRYDLLEDGVHQSTTQTDSI